MNISDVEKASELWEITQTNSAMRALTRCIEIGNAKDDLGHDLKNSVAYKSAMKLLKDGHADQE